jgi:hypothetical protein
LNLLSSKGIKKIYHQLDVSFECLQIELCSMNISNMNGESDLGYSQISVLSKFSDLWPIYWLRLGLGHMSVTSLDVNFRKWEVAIDLRIWKRTLIWELDAMPWNFQIQYSYLLIVHSSKKYMLCHAHYKAWSTYIYVRLRSTTSLDVNFRKWEVAIDLRIWKRTLIWELDAVLRIWKKDIDLGYRCLWHREWTWIWGLYVD